MENGLQNYGVCNPIKIQEKKWAAMLVKEAAVRWSDDRFHHVLEMLLTPGHRQLFLPQETCPSEQSGPRTFALTTWRLAMTLGSLSGHLTLLARYLCACTDGSPIRDTLCQSLDLSSQFIHVLFGKRQTMIERRFSSQDSEPASCTEYITKPEV